MDVQQQQQVVGADGLTGLGRGVVVHGEAPMTLARAFLRHQFGTPSGYLGMWFVNGDFLVWEGGRWKTVGIEWVENRLWRWLEGATWEKVTAAGNVQERVKLDRTVVGNVTRALMAVTEKKWLQTPAWGVVGRGEPNPKLCVGFEDCVVSVEGGVVRTFERDERWIDNMVVPAKWDPEAKCERWMQCLKEWGQGDVKWERLAQCVMGMALMAERRWAWLPILYGVSRSGKGVFADTMRKLLGGCGWFSTSTTEVMDRFGLEGIQNARVMSVAEYAKEPTTAVRFERILKEVLGEEELTVNVRYQSAKKVKSMAMPLLQTNVLPEMANTNQGLTTKLVILPFERSFKDSPQLDLREVLEGELAGIAAWAMEGARRLAEMGQMAREVPDAARAALMRFRTQGNVVESFLEARFERWEGAAVSHEVVWTQWEDYLGRVGYKGPEASVSRDWFGKLLEEKCSWQLRRRRIWVPDEEGVRKQVRMIEGLRVRKTPDDELA